MRAWDTVLYSNGTASDIRGNLWISQNFGCKENVFALFSNRDEQNTLIQKQDVAVSFHKG